jgi:predicted Zn-dependent peptidase
MNMQGHERNSRARRQAAHVQETIPVASKAGAKIQEHKLENGLTILLVERHLDPVVAVMLWYKVGARNESEREAGVSHFLEHMMFKGTPRFGKGEVDRETTILGGSNNAFTTPDHTAYWFELASDRWEKALEIEADRMKSLLLDPAEFEAEKAVVLEELAMGDDDPWRSLSQEVQALLFPRHPYRRPVIGYPDTLKAMKPSDMRDYYARFYQPGNAILVIAGDIDPESAMQSVRAHFGSILGPKHAAQDGASSSAVRTKAETTVRAPRNAARNAGRAGTKTADTKTADTGTSDTGTSDSGTADTETTDSGTADDGATNEGASSRADAYRAPQLEPRGERRLSMHWDDNGSRLCMAWPTVVVGTDDDFALDLVSALLTGGRMSRLHRKLVLERGLATSVSTHNDTRIDTGAFWLHAECAQGVAPETLESAIDAEIGLLSREIAGTAELERAKKILAASEAHESETVSDLAEDLGEFAADASWRMALETVDRIRRVNAKAVRDCAARLLRKDRRVVGWSLPREKVSAAKMPSTKMPPRMSAGASSKLPSAAARHAENQRSESSSAKHPGRERSRSKPRNSKPRISSRQRSSSSASASTSPAVAAKAKSSRAASRTSARTRSRARSGGTA